MVVNLRWVGRGAFTVGLLWHLWPSGTFMVTDKFFWFFCWSICAVFVHQNIVIFSTFTPSQCLYRFGFSLFLHIEFSIQLNGYLLYFLFFQSFVFLYFESIQLSGYFWWRPLFWRSKEMASLISPLWSPKQQISDSWLFSLFGLNCKLTTLLKSNDHRSPLIVLDEVQKINLFQKSELAAYFSSVRVTFLTENKNTFHPTRGFSNGAFIMFRSYNLCSFLLWKWWCQWNWSFPWEFVSWAISLTPCFPNMSFPQILRTLRDTWGCQFQKAIGKDSQSQVW